MTAAADPHVMWVVAGGIYCWAFGLFHLMFWRLFGWREELARLRHVNRAIMQVLNLCLTWVFAVFGYLCVAYPVDLAHTPLGRALLAAIALFWLFRAVEQVVFFGLRHWVSKVFLLLFVGGAVLFAMPLMEAA